MRRLIGALVGAAALAAAGPSAAVTYTFVGSWFVDDGPSWLDNPPVYSGQEAAALLFGGNAGDYAISSVDSDPDHIDFMAFYDGFGDSKSCGSNGPCAQDMHFDVHDDGYEFPFDAGKAYSAYVSDHSLHLQNFAFRVSGDDQQGAVPEPSAWALMILGFGAAGSVLRRRARLSA